MTVKSEGRIACIGWGSLVWSPGDLPVSGGWNEDGPDLPVEFARQSQRDKKMSLVICESGPRVRTLWAGLDVADLTTAKAALAKREGITNPEAKSIGFWEAASGKSQGMEEAVIANWAASRNLSKRPANTR